MVEFPVAMVIRGCQNEVKLAQRDLDDDGGFLQGWGGIHFTLWQLIHTIYHYFCTIQQDEQRLRRERVLIKQNRPLLGEGGI